MVTIFYSFLTNSLNIIFFVILLALLEPVLKKYFSAVFLYRAWVILLLGLLIPMRFEYTKALFYISSPQIVEEEKAFYEPGRQEKDEFNNTSAHASQLHEEVTRNKWDSDNLTKPGAPLWWELLQRKFSNLLYEGYLFVSLIWMAGAIILLLMKGFQYDKHRKRLKRFMTPMKDTDLQGVLCQCIGELLHDNDVRRGQHLQPDKIMIYRCSIISSPMSLGIFKPAILLPDEPFMKKDLHFILKHELIHIQRRDSLIKLIRLIVLSVNWYNPFCYLLSKHLDDWCEASCDERVLYKSTRSECLDYGALLIKCAATKNNMAFLTNLYGGKNNMKSRLCSILDRRKKYSSRLLLVLLFAVVSTTVFVSVSSEVRTTSKGVIGAKNEISMVSEGSIDQTMDIVSADQKNDDFNDASYNETRGKEIKAASIDAKKPSDKPSIRETLVEYAMQSEGTPFLWGSNDLSIGVDSSGFAQAIYKKLDYDLPRTSREQADFCEKISFDDILPGDLIFYASSPDDVVNHVGIYIGDDKVIHAKNAKDGVIIQDINYRTPDRAGRVISD